MALTEKEFLTRSPDRALCELIALATDKGVLKRVTLSLPVDKTLVRATLTPRSIGGKTLLQLESFYADNKARHVNLASTDERSLIEVLALYRQVNVLTTLPSGDCERKRASSGKETLLRGAKLFRLLNATEQATAPVAHNDREKQYILTGREPFLRALGVSDESGRVYDKKRAKFRQINRFLELLRDVEEHLPDEGLLTVCDLCCGKSYLSFAVYHYLTAVKGRQVEMYGVDLKSDVIADCAAVAERLDMCGLHFVCGDVAAFEPDAHVHLVVSLHACDTATDLVLGKALRWGSEVVLSTPCCHHELNHTLDCPELACVAAHSMLRQKLCDAATDAMRLLLLEAHGYAVEALELIDPEETPKNVMLRAVKRKNVSAAALARAHENYAAAVRFFVRTEGEAQDAWLKRDV